MAVAIFGHNDFGKEDNSEEFEYTPVSGEHSFITLWEPAIAYLGITRLANGIYLKREELPQILDDFRKIKKWILNNPSIDESEKVYVVNRIDWLIVELPIRWQKCPNAKTLWMG